MGGRTFAVVAGVAALVTSVAAVAVFASPVDPAVAAHHAALFAQPANQVLGNPRGDVTIVEYFDYACPFCKAAEPRVEALLQADKGVRLEVKEFPVLGPESMVASRAALAAARQNKYAAFHQALLLHRGGLDEGVIYAVAQDVGLDIARLKKDMTDPAIAATIQANLKLANDVHVQGTPTFIVNDHIVTQPSATLDFMQLARNSRQGHR